MITLLIICFVIYAFYKAGSKDKKSIEDIVNKENKIASLSNMSFVAKEMTFTQNVLNKLPSKYDLLQEFGYTSNTKTIYLKMKDGRYVKCPLSQLDVLFDNVKGTYRIAITHNNSFQFSFYVYNNIFKDTEWKAIIDTLTLAGTTRNAAIMKSF